MPHKRQPRFTRNCSTGGFPFSKTFARLPSYPWYSRVMVSRRSIEGNTSGSGSIWTSSAFQHESRQPGCPSVSPSQGTWGTSTVTVRLSSGGTKESSSRSVMAVRYSSIGCGSQNRGIMSPLFLSLPRHCEQTHPFTPAGDCRHPIVCSTINAERAGTVMRTSSGSGPLA